ncbi:reverse transcriptase domain-containing protein [Tanacetum coccineum]
MKTSLKNGQSTGHENQKKSKRSNSAKDSKPKPGKVKPQSKIQSKMVNKVNKTPNPLACPFYNNHKRPVVIPEVIYNLIREKRKNRDKKCQQSQSKNQFFPRVVKEWCANETILFIRLPQFTLYLHQGLIEMEDGEARDWLDKEPPRSILTWDDLVSKFINQYFPPSKTTYYRNEIITFYQKPNEAFNEAWERFKGLLRQCPHHGFSELHQLDTFYNSLNSNDQDALDSAAGGNFLDKMPQEGLAIIESKSKVRYSRSRANDSRVSTDAPLSNSSPSNNSFDMQQIAASLEDKMTIKMNKMLNEMKALVVTTPAPVKAVEETISNNFNKPQPLEIFSKETNLPIWQVK